MNGLDWNQVRDEYRPRAVNAKTNQELRVVLEEMLALLGESHFGILAKEIYEPPTPTQDAEASPSSNENEVLRSETEEVEVEVEAATPESETSETPSNYDGTLGIKLKIVENAVYIREVDLDSNAYTQGVRIGWQLTAIGTQSVAESLKSLFENIQDPKEAEFYGTRLANGWIKPENKDGLTLSFRDEKGQDNTLKLLPKKRQGTRNNMGMMPSFLNTFETKIISEGKIGYIRFSEWAPPVVERFTEAVQNFKSSGADKGLIIDLRENPGGVAALSIGVASHLISSKGHSLGIMQDRTMTLNLRVFPRPKSQRWNGPVVILIDGLSASTSEIFAGGMQDLKEATIVGSPSSGKALASMIESLPNGDRMQFVIWNLTRTSGERIEGAGVTPDIEVSITHKTLLSGTDPVLQTGIDFLLNESQRTQNP